MYQEINPRAGDVGLVFDIAPSQLPQTGWSGGRNVRTINGRLAKVMGPSQFLTTCPIVPYKVFGIRVEGIVYWIACGLQKVYVNNGSSWTNITRQSGGVDVNYTMTANNRWSVEFFNGVVILNNQVDPPQFWPAGVVSTKLDKLTNWPTGNIAQFLRSFKEFLFAFGGEIGGQDATYTLGWSAPADPGTVPNSWDYTDPTTQAGDAPLASTGGTFVDAMAYAEDLIVYKSDSCYKLDFVGGVGMFQLNQVFRDIGMLTQDCGVEFNKKHFVVTPNDIVIHDTFTWQSVVDGKTRKYIFDQLDSSQVKNCFVVKNSKYSEIWFCFPSKGATYPDTAFVWSYKDNSTTFRDIPLATSAVEYVVDPTAVDDTWAGGAAGTFDTTTDKWNADFTDVTNTQVIMCSPSDSNLYMMDQLNTNNGALIEAYAERVGYANIPASDGQSMLIRPDLKKMVTAVYPRLTATGPVDIYLGSQDRPDDGITWKGPFSFDPNKKKKATIITSGYYLGFRIYSKADISWELDGFGFDMKVIGKYI